MEMHEIIKQAEENIRQAVRDYGRHTYQMTVIEDISDGFIERLAKDSSYAKQGLRELFSKSPVWDAKLDALVINGTRTHDPDYQLIRDLARQILWAPLYRADDDQKRDILQAIDFFAAPNNDYAREQGIEAMKRIDPKAYIAGKKPSRIFKAICVALGVADDTAGSAFQRLYAQFADELTTRKIGFKLYVSINPAHFLTMSNPKCDQRGNTLISCHSLNSTEYSYNNGCTGYARDETSFIVFTVADPSDPETFNNRKTTRQIFAYIPGSGFLLQSRMYNTSGGVRGQTADSKLYRDLIQRELSELEGVPNLWRTLRYYGSEYKRLVREGDGFGGYPDWIYEDFGARVCIRADHDNEDVFEHRLVIGTYGLCVKCGEECSQGVICDGCKEPVYDYYCAECGDGFDDEDDLYRVHDQHGNEVMVCESCLGRHYTCCDRCNEYYHNDRITWVDLGEYVCKDCLDEYYEECDECEEYCDRDDMCNAFRDGKSVRICENCRDRHYMACDHCGEYHHGDNIVTGVDADGNEVQVCRSCYDNYYAQNEVASDNGAPENEEGTA